MDRLLGKKKKINYLAHGLSLGSSVEGVHPL
jgi:hypothetical protein